jgi:hypothetical protein
MALVLCATFASATPFESSATTTPVTQLDKLVFDRLQKLGITPANPCSDAVFVRRVYLDLIGTLPTAQAAHDFIESKDTDKRKALIERLMLRNEFADYWAMKWCDLLRVKAEFPINLWPNAAQAYHHWIRTGIKENKPYDQFVRALLIEGGSNFRVPPVNFYRAMQNRDPQGIAQTVALTFMGARADKWPKDQLDGMAAFFSQLSFKSTLEWKEEIVYFNPTISNAATRATFPGGATVTFDGTRDPRIIFADWLITPQNPWFTRNIANRVWAWLFGRGIIHEPDDMRADNPPSNPELLAYLERELVNSRYDLKHLYRLILNSQTYQLSSIPKSKDPSAAANFASYPLRRLEAEVLIDALNLITGSNEEYSSPIPEPFTFIPKDQRAIALPDGSISSSFLELFGKPPRDTGFESERSTRPTAAQRLHMLNSSHVQKKIEGSAKLQVLMQGKGTSRDIANSVYLTILSRYPTEAELATVGSYAKPGGAKGRESVLDLAWALINTTEFLYRH